MTKKKAVLNARSMEWVLKAAMLTAATTVCAQSGVPGTSEKSLRDVVVEGARQGSLESAPETAKTGTPLKDLPRSVQTIERELIDAQNVFELRQAVRNVSNVVEASGTTYGFFDRFFIRGLEQTFLLDGIPDGPTTNGYRHSMVGVERIEILKGPGSSLYGHGQPGGTINIVRKRPEWTQSIGVAGTLGEFGLKVAELEATGPLGSSGLAYRIDAQAYGADGYRGLFQKLNEIMPAIAWRDGAHRLTLSYSHHDLKNRVDNYGILFRNNAPLPVSLDTKYYTPFGRVEQQVDRLVLAHSWKRSETLTVDTRLSWLGRDLDLLRNAGGAIAGAATTSTGRQLRRQLDDADDYVFQIEPQWRFGLGGTRHNLLIGFEQQRRKYDSYRETATLPNIANVFNPAIPETSLAGLRFTRNFDRKFVHDFTGLYATDQIDLTSRWKARVGLRRDRFSATGSDLVVGNTSRADNRASWEIGTGYEVLPGLTPFVGAARSHLAVISAEQSTVDREPERGTQAEIGAKFAAFGKALQGSVAAFDARRENFLQTIGTVTTAIGEQRTRGTELDLTFNRGPWLVVANYAVQRAKLTNLPSDLLSQGNRPAGVPHDAASVWASYRLAGPGAGQARIGGGIRKVGSFYADNRNLIAIAGHTVADLGVSYKLGAAEMRFDIRNLFDKDYFRHALSSGALPGDPRTVSLTLRYLM